jgi:Xaa-Pro aminopeptidase
MRDSSIRIAQTRKKMIEKGLDALLLARSVSIRYLTGMDMSDGIFLLTKTTSFLFLDGRYDGLGRRLFHNGKVVRLTKEYRSLQKLVQHMRCKRVGYDAKSSSFISLLKPIKPRTHFSLIKNLVEDLRIIKSKKEIRDIQHACTISDRIYEEIKNSIDLNMSEWELQKLLRKTAWEHDVLDMAFDPIVAFGKNTSYPHYMLAQKDKIVKKGDMVLLDFGMAEGGYKSDMTRMVFMGKPSKAIRKLYTTVLDIQEKVIAGIRPGNKISDTVLLYQHLMKKAGLYRFVRHALGHGVGLEIHEAPALTIKNHDCWTPGMVVAIEPGIYRNNQFGIRIEDTILVGKRGPIYLTKSSKQIEDCTVEIA